MKKNNKNKRLFIFIAGASIACSSLVLLHGMRTDIVIWAATLWMLLVGAAAALTIFDQPDKPRGAPSAGTAGEAYDRRRELTPFSISF